MGKVFDDDELEKWIRSRPESIQKMIQAHPPEKRYRYKSRKTCLVYSYEENGTVTVLFPLGWNPEQVFTPDYEERLVFGIDPADLTPI